MSLEHMQTIEVKDPKFGESARTISGLAAELKADGHDQDTIRHALNVFSQASSEAARNSVVSGEAISLGRRHY